LILDKIEKIFYKYFYFWKWAQIEPTTYCNGSCIYCPRTVYKNVWINAHLSLKNYLNILNNIFSVRMIYLQGWGEPFLNQELFEMIHQTKKNNLLIGITSNGTLITEDIAKKLVELKVDFISFSLAGFEKNNDIIRKNTSFKKVFEAIELISKYKNFYNSSKPVVHIAYIWFKSIYKDLKFLIRFLKNFEVKEIVVHPLTFVPSRELEKEVIYLEDKFLKFAEQLKEENQKVKIHIYFITNKIHSCPDDILRSFFVNFNGKVSPCTLSLLPVKNQVIYYFRNKAFFFKPIILGNLLTENLLKVWSNFQYKQFRREYYNSFCKNCYKLFLTNFPMEKTSYHFIPSSTK